MITINEMRREKDAFFWVLLNFLSTLNKTLQFTLILSMNRTNSNIFFIYKSNSDISLTYKTFIIHRSQTINIHLINQLKIEKSSTSQNFLCEFLFCIYLLLYYISLSLSLYIVRIN